MPHLKYRSRVDPRSDSDLKCRCGSRAVWWVFASSVRPTNQGGFIWKRVGPYCPKCCKDIEFSPK